MNGSGETVFQAFVDASEKLKELWHRCASHPSLLPEETIQTTNLRRYESGPVLELYLDAESPSGKAFAWCVEIRPLGNKWAIERSVRMNDHFGQHMLRDFDVIGCDSDDELAVRLPGLVAELVATFEETKFD